MASTCNCLAAIPKRFVDEQPIKEVKIIEADIKQVVFMFDDVGTRTKTDIELKCVGRKRPVVKTLIHSFCPFCGTKYQVDNKVKITTATVEAATGRVIKEVSRG